MHQIHGHQVAGSARAHGAFSVHAGLLVEVDRFASSGPDAEPTGPVVVRVVGRAASFVQGGEVRGTWVVSPVDGPRDRPGLSIEAPRFALDGTPVEADLGWHRLGRAA